MAGISEDKLRKILQHNMSSGLMTERGDKMMNQYKNNGPTGGFDTLDGDNYSQDYDDSLYSDSINEGYSDYTKDAINENSKLPEAIRKSMLEKRIDTSKLGERPVTEQLGLKPIKKQQPINEVVQHQQQTMASPAIDYSLIKTIVNECLKEHLSNQQNLNEATLKTIGLSQGKIKLVDNKGNIYAAKLELQGNVNDKKGK